MCQPVTTGAVYNGKRTGKVAAVRVAVPMGVMV